MNGSENVKQEDKTENINEENQVPAQPEQKIIDMSKIEKLRRRKRMRRVRICVAVCLLLAAALIVWLTGIASSSVNMFSDTVDDIKILAARGKGFPAVNTVEDICGTAKLSNSFAVLGKKEVTVFSNSGASLLTLQHGYANPRITQGKNRFCVYNQSGTQIIVSGRISSLYEKTFDQSILFAQMSENGTLGVVTTSDSHKAELTVYSESMEKMYVWKSAEAYPLSMVFAKNGKDMAVAAVNSVNGEMQSTIYLLRVGDTEEKGKIERSGSLPIKVKYLSADRLLVVYDDCAVVYGTGNLQQQYSYNYPSPIVAVSEENTSALSFVFGYENQPQSMNLVILDSNLNETAKIPLGVKPQGVCTYKNSIYVICGKKIKIYDSLGTLTAEKQTDGIPYAVIAAKQPLLVGKNEIDELL